MYIFYLVNLVGVVDRTDSQLSDLIFSINWLRTECGMGGVCVYVGEMGGGGWRGGGRRLVTYKQKGKIHY